MTTEDIDAVCGLVLDLCGVYLDQSKAYLIESRLQAISKSAGCERYAELVRKIRFGHDPKLKNAVIDAITTHETLFFRDNSPFEALKNRVLPDAIDRNAKSLFPKRLRIWSAACSTGQEPYSIAMAISEMIPDVSSWDIRILGTDVSDDAVAKASTGLYLPHEIERGLDAARLNRFFSREGQSWRVRPELRAMCSFQQRNLLQTFATLGPFDVIFCRNVAIYFQPTARADLFRRLTDVLVPGGALFAGSQESLADLGPRFQPQLHCRGVFYLPNGPAIAGLAK